ncbi:MAG: 4a-hydroxytetrahydrobiopterin dehydratase [Patescibacteria group bacterium]
MDLTQQKCVPCEGGTEPMTKADAEAMREYHVKDWILSADAKNISRKFEFKDFAEALDFVNKVGVIAETEGHHPDIHLADYKFVTVDLSTHAIGGLSQNDFIVAAKINVL